MEALSIKMKHGSNITRFCPGLTLLEMVIAMAIMAILFAVLVPQLRAIQNSWDSNANSAEALQNGRVLIDHLNRNLSKAARITAVSDSNTVNGYIEFTDNDANSFRYDVNGASNYVEFGLVGSLSDLAGPVNQFQFTCYDACDLNIPITNTGAIRSVKVETTLANTALLGQNKTFTTQAYLRANNCYPLVVTKATPFEYDILKGQAPALLQIDSTHYLCAYAGNLDHGDAVVLAVNPTTWAVSRAAPFEYDATQGKTPALSQIDATHFLCAYSGAGNDGWAVVLTVDTGTWNVTKETPFEYDTDYGATPALAKIDNSHYLCVYTDGFSDGQAVVLTVNTGTWIITKGTPFEYDTDHAVTPALAKIDDSHYLCVYADKFSDGQAVVLTVNTGTWNITKAAPFEYDITNGQSPALLQIDPTHYLCAYTGPVNSGWAVVLTVNTGDWSISRETAFEYDETTGIIPDLAQMDPDNYLCVSSGQAGAGNAAVLTVDSSVWTISRATDFFEYESTVATTPCLAKIDPAHYLCAYTSLGDDGWSVILKSTGYVLP